MDFDAAFDALLDRERTIHDAKRNDYTGGLDPLYNYRKSAEVMGISCALGMVGRLQEKVTRLSVLLRDGAERKVEDEKIADTCIDIAIIAKLIAIEAGDA